MQSGHAASFAAALWSIAAAAASGGTPLPEGFENLGGICGEGPCRLQDEGWAFVDQGTLANGPAWQPSFFDDVPAHSGDSFMRCLKGGDTGSVATWAILPDIPGAGAGDVLSFFARGEVLEDGVFEVRYSPTGGVSTGSAPADVGDFTEVLVTTTSLTHEGWQPVAATLPGDGRIALRVYDPFQPFGGLSTVVSVDTMALNAELPGPPVPGDGETVVWTTQISPISIDTNLVIPQGGTVIVEPGVVVEVTPDASLAVNGELIAHGLPSDPITITGPFSFVEPPIRVGGLLEMRHVVGTGFFRTRDGTIDAQDCNFPGGFLASDSLSNASQLILVNNCTFTDGGIGAQDGQVAVRNSDFVGGGISITRGYLYVDNVTIDGAALSFHRQRSPQSILIDNVSVTNSNTIAALNLDAWNFLIGPNVTLQNSVYPVQLNGGLLPGSVLPTSGNTNNFIYVASPESPNGRAVWSPLAIPYVLEGSVGAGQTILPGTTVRFTPGASLEADASIPLFAEGLPGQPIVFEPHTGGQWAGVFFQSNSTAPKLDYCVFRGANIGTGAGDTPELRVENCVYEGNNVGSNSNTFAVTTVRKSRFLDNTVGVQGTKTGSFNVSGATNPTSFEGNTVGASDPDGQPLAQFNWWGDPSGPQHPDNPGGTGDPATGNVQVLPFRTTPPDFDDHPPVVRLKRHSSYAETGDTLIISWDAFDNPGGSIVSQRLLFTPHFAGTYEVIADDIPPSQRSIAVTVPEVLASSNNNPPVFRLVALDDAGQEGIDQMLMPIPFVFTGPGGGGALGAVPTPDGPFVMGEEMQLGGGTVSRELHFDATGDVIQLGVLSDPNAPFVSTDLARIAVVDFQTGTRQFSGYFSIRPDGRIGDAPPTVTLTSPAGGSFQGGAVVPIGWTASDDESVRSFTVQASTDGGKTWQFLAEDLPGTSTSYSWRLPPLKQGIADARVRVVAFDHRFQSSSDTSGAITLTPGDAGPPADLDGDGAVTGSDLAILLGAWGTDDPAADLDDSGMVGGADLALLLGAWTG